MQPSYNVAHRREKLLELLSYLEQNQKRIDQALKKDLGKSEFEAYLSETGYVLRDLKYQIRNITTWAKPKRVRPSLLNFPSTDRIVPTPYGKVLIFSPWNYPYQLALAPFISAYAAGNSVTVKPSELAPHTAQIIEEILHSVFDPIEVRVIQGDATRAQELLETPWDYIFFTGGTEIGRSVAQAAARHLTPVTLELGGKNPCVVLADANIELTAKRLVWGKFLNAGQTCIAPDFLLVDSQILEPLKKQLIQEIESAYGKNPELSPDYGRIIDKAKTSRLKRLVETSQYHWIYGGQSNPENRYMEPTLVEVKNLETDLMQEEIFGPILPIYAYQSQEDLKTILKKNTHSLAFYVFGSDKKCCESLVLDQPCGGSCINDTLIHFANDRLPFGGIGNSGHGAYHGKYSYRTFSHEKAVVQRATWLDIPMRYAPFSGKIDLLKKFLKWL